MTQASLGNAQRETVDEQSVHRISQDPVVQWEQWWVRTADYLNPIMIKEVRQSLKSRQFEFSFGITLLCMVGWTVFAISSRVPEIYYIPSGNFLLSGYMTILTFPLMVVIPFQAFRSLTMEMEDNTYELLSISSLSAKQIIQGKVATAVVQILLYLSALTPCIALTYLLRGVSLFSVLLLVAGVAGYSLLLVALSVLVASSAKTRSGQGGMSILLLVALVFSFFSNLGLVSAGAAFEIFGDTPEKLALLVVFTLITIGLVAYSLMIQSAAAAIDFPSENKSTPIRRRILVLVGVLLFWFFFYMQAFATSASPIPSGYEIGFVVWLWGFLMFIGGMVCGERGIVSPRAQRTLPATAIGRLFFTWLNPGGGLGYLFVCTLYGTTVLFLWAVIELSGLTTHVAHRDFPEFSLVLFLYLIFYVGVGRLLMLMVNQRTGSRILVSMFTLGGAFGFLHFVPYLIALAQTDFQRADYSVLQALNVFMTLQAIQMQDSMNLQLSIFVLALAGFGVFGLNLFLTSRDVLLLRIETPERVRRELEKPKPVVETPDPFAD